MQQMMSSLALFARYNKTCRALLMLLTLDY